MDTPFDLARQKNLIVLIPDSLAGNLDLAHRIFWIAQREHCDIFYLTLVDDEEKILPISRSMTTMKAVTAGNCLDVQSKLVETAHWLEALREIYRPGDRIVCQQEQSVKTGFLQTIPIAQYLHDTLDAPTSSLSGFYHPGQVQVSRWLHSLIAWMGLILILLGFTFGEIQLDPLSRGFMGKALLFLIVMVEIGVIWFWNRYTAQ